MIKSTWQIFLNDDFKSFGIYITQKIHIFTFLFNFRLTQPLNGTAFRLNYD